MALILLVAHGVQNRHDKCRPPASKPRCVSQVQSNLVSFDSLRTMKLHTTILALSLASLVTGLSGEYHSPSLSVAIYMSANGRIDPSLHTRDDTVSVPQCDQDKKLCWTGCSYHYYGASFVPNADPYTPGGDWCWQSQQSDDLHECEDDSDCLDVESSTCLASVYLGRDGIVGGCGPSLGP